MSLCYTVVYTATSVEDVLKMYCEAIESNVSGGVSAAIFDWSIAKTNEGSSDVLPILLEAILRSLTLTNNYNV